jgi:hypothetical protein
MARVHRVIPSVEKVPPDFRPLGQLLEILAREEHLDVFKLLELCLFGLMDHFFENLGP